MTEAKARIAFFGTPDFAVPCLKALATHKDVQVCLAITQPDRPAGRGGKLQAPPVKVAAQSLGIPVFQPERLKKEQGGLAELCPQPDLGIVVAFGQILPLSVLTLPRLGCVNVHASLLPRWRGAAPIQRAILAGDNRSGVCLMQMDQGLDTGSVLFSKAVEITSTDNFGSLHDKLSLAGAELLRTHVQQILSGSVQPIPQDEAGVEYAAKISNAECQINWADTAERICLQIRALSPFPGAFTSLAGKRVKIFSAEVTKSLSNSNTLSPGGIACLDKHRLEIRCGQDLLSLHEVQIEGKKRLPIAEFIKGSALSSSTIFGA